MIKVVIFDWGRTLFNSETKQEFLESEDILKFCKSHGLRLALISLVSANANATLEERNAQIESSPLRAYFEIIRTTDTDKDALCVEVVKYFGVAPFELAIIDDRTIRGIAWGNRYGCTTVWLRKGRFSEELPSEATGQPTYTITDLLELKKIL